MKPTAALKVTENLVLLEYCKCAYAELMLTSHHLKFFFYLDLSFVHWYEFPVFQ